MEFIMELTLFLKMWIFKKNLKQFKTSINVEMQETIIPRLNILFGIVADIVAFSMNVLTAR